MAPEKKASYTVLKEFVVSRPNHTDGDITMSEGSLFDPVADGFQGTIAEFEALIADGFIAENYDGPMAKYKVTGQIFPLNEDGTPQETALEIGSIHEIPAGAWDDFVADGRAVLITDEETVTTGAEADETAAATAASEGVEKTHYYMGKAIASHYLRKVGDKQYHHIRLEDGSEHDLTAEDYKAVLEA